MAAKKAGEVDLTKLSVADLNALDETLRVEKRKLADQQLAVQSELEIRALLPQMSRGTIERLRLAGHVEPEGELS